jgi:hypothetical protein
MTQAFPSRMVKSGAIPITPRAVNIQLNMISAMANADHLMPLRLQATKTLVAKKAAINKQTSKNRTFSTRGV